MESPFVTVLCTDGVGPGVAVDAASGASRREHVARLRQPIAEHGGREVASTGTGLVVFFPSAVAAVRCAIDMQRTTAAVDGGTGLRIGLAAGEPFEAGDDLSSAPVVIASRLCDAAARGQVLVSDVVRQLARSREAAIAPVGTLRLRGVSERVSAAEVHWRDGTPPAPAVAPTPTSEITVVIADDERLLRTGFRVILESEHDISVIGEAGDGRTALDVVRRRRPDVVLMDVRMPELDGLQAATQILADPEVQTAVLMLTTFDLNAYVYEALRIGASGFLLKDTPADRLLDAVRVVAAGDALLAPSITRRLIERFVHVARPEPGAVPDAFAELTTRELDVLRLVAAGRSNREIADELVLGTNTVKTHVARVLAKLGLRDRVQAVVLAYESGLITPDQGA